VYYEKNITFFCTDGVEIDTIQNILQEANKRGYTTKISRNILERAEIGFYCQHVAFPKSSKLSIVLLHDMAQGHNRWPNIWEFEPWDEFDIGILPGKSWEERWQTSCWHPFTRTKRGVYLLGWPKADTVFAHDLAFREEIESLRSRLDLKYKRSILYAPSWENDGKQDQFVRSLKSLPVDLLLKQAPWSRAFPEIRNNIEAMNALHRNIAPNVHIIEPDISIMFCIGISDIIVSDESSVMLEGLLLDVPSIAVTDWRIPDCRPPRNPSIPFDFVYKTDSNNLRHMVELTLFSLDDVKDCLKESQRKHFVNLGGSSTQIMDLVDSLVHTNSTRMKPVVPCSDLKNIDLPIRILRKYRKMKSLLKIVLKRLSQSFTR